MTKDGRSTAADALRVRSDHKAYLRRRRKIQRAIDQVDSISSLPDVILQHILCLLQTKLAISTSVLSKRWRHVWCDTPCLSFNADDTSKAAASIKKTLRTRYTAPKMTNFHLETTLDRNIPHIERLIEFAMSHNVENLSLKLDLCSNDYKYKFPEFFYTNSSVKQLSIKLSFPPPTIISNSSVSWTSLRKLSLNSCSLTDESMANILSGCPVLENLALCFCMELEVLDLSKSLRLRTLQINRPGRPTQIMAPHINYLRLRTSQLLCTLVDVASLTEAKLNICFLSMFPNLEAGFLQAMVLNMLKKLQNAEKLTFGGNFLQVLSLAELRGVAFPMFKVKALTLETVIFEYVIPGIKRLLQNSPDLEKLTLRARDCNTIPVKCLKDYLNKQGLNTNQCWISKDDGVVWNTGRWNLELKHVVSLVELVLKNTKQLDKMVLLLNKRYLKFKIEELLPILSHNKNVFISLSPESSEEDEW